MRDLKAQLEGLEQLQDTMQRVNDYYRKDKTLDGCPHMPADQIETVKAAMDLARGWRAEVKPFDSYALISNNAAIHRLKDRIEALSRPQEQMSGAVPDSIGRSGQMCAEERLATEFYEVAWLCTPGQSEDSTARAAQISGLTQLLRQEGKRAANQMLLAVSDFVAGAEVPKVIQLTAQQFRHFSANLLRDMPFITTNRDLTGHDKGVTRCLLVTTRSNRDGICDTAAGGQRNPHPPLPRNQGFTDGDSPHRK